MNIEQLIKLNIELEGLLRVIANRETPEAKELAAAKYNELKSAFDEFFAPAETPQIVIEEPAQPLNIEVETPVVETPVAETPVVETPIVQPMVVSEETVDEHPAVVEPEAAAPVEIQQKPQDNVVTTADEIAAARQNEVRVDEMLTRREARDIRKAFTLNDKFRFRRELFANNDALFAETLNLLSAMQNLDEAVEYLRDDMGWDMDNDDVKDFVNIVSNHFA